MSNIILCCNLIKGDCSRGELRNYEKQIVRKGKLQAEYGLLEWKDKNNLVTKDSTKELIIENGITNVNGVELIVVGANNLKAVGYII